MANLSDIKFVQAARPHQLDPVTNKRRKLIARIDEQLAAFEAIQQGGVYSRTVHRRVRDLQTDESTVQIHSRRVVPWWWIDKDSKVYLAVRYGTKILELSKGKQAIQLDGQTQIPLLLAKLRAATVAGELDGFLAQAGEQLRKRFKAH